MAPKKQYIIDTWKPLVEEHGLVALTDSWVDLNNMRSHINKARKLGYNRVDIARELGKDFDTYRAEKMGLERRERFIQRWRDLYKEHGIQVLTRKWLTENKLIPFLGEAYKKNLRLRDVSQLLEVEGEFDRLQEEFPHDFAGKSREFVLDALAREWKSLYEKHGIKAMSTEWAKKNNKSGLVAFTFKFKMNPEKFAEKLGLSQEWKESRACTQESYDRKVQECLDKYKCIPQADFLDSNGYTIITHHLKDFGGGSIRTLRKRFGVENIKNQAKCGLYTDSWAETCYLDYLFAHGIKIVSGDKYPAEYSAETGQTWGKYDPGFVATQGVFSGEIILVEIFGNSPGGNLDYARVQQGKIEFNKRYPNFLALNFKDCYDDNKLASVLKPYIGSPERIVLNEALPHSPATMLSRIDDTLKRCQAICDKMPDGILPSLTWFQRTQKHKSRERLSWEPVTWDGLVEAISRLGWVDVRSKMKRTEAQILYERLPVLKEVKELYEKFGYAPSVVSSRLTPSFKNHTPEEREWFNKGNRVYKACKRLFPGGQEEAVELCKNIMH